MSFTLLFSSYLFHFFPLPCSHIFSWCLLSLAVAWVATSRKYWFLPSLLFLSCSHLSLYKPSSSISFSFPVLRPRLCRFTVSWSFFPQHSVLTSRCGFQRAPCYVVAERKGRGVLWGGGGGVSLLHHFTVFFPTFITAAQARVQALGLLSTSATDGSFPWQNTNNCKLLPLVRSPQSEMSDVDTDLLLCRRAKTRTPGLCFK